jgi:glycosyltransferase involved in cell wall biosynthesis
MNFLQEITVLILTYNEAPNIGRTLAALERFPEVVVLDSCSTDETAQIATTYDNVRFFTRPFDQHATQWNFGLQNCGIRRPWVLALDADYFLPETLIDEISALQPTEAQCGYQASFRYCIKGRQLSGSLYPSHVVLFRRQCAFFVQTGHTQRLMVEGDINALDSLIQHDDRKSLGHWLSSQQRYAKLEAEYLERLPPTSLRVIDRIRRTGVLGPPFSFLYALIAKRCIFDGWAGWLYVLQRVLAETMIAAEVIDRKLQNQAHDDTVL